MPEPIITPNPAQTAAATPTGQSQAAATAFTMPDKFKDKSAEDIARAYSELESQHGKMTNELGKYKGYDEVVKIGSPKDIVEGIQWARQVNAALKSGQITYKQAQTAIAQGPQGDGSSQAPWDNESFDYLTPREQAKAITEYNKTKGFGDTKSYIDQIANQYGTQIQQQYDLNNKQQNILLKAIKTAIKNPDVDVEDLLTQAAELAGKGPEELLNMAMEARMAPKAQEAEVQKRVAALMAEKDQERQNNELKLINNATGRRPVFAKQTKTRDDENKAIFENLRKQGIDLLR